MHLFKKHMEDYLNTFRIKYIMKFKGIRNVEFFAKGKRGRVFTGNYNGKKVAIKVNKKINNEKSWLKLLNKHKIGPKFIYSGKDYIVYEFIDGKRILDYISENDKKEIIKVLKEAFRQCRTLDRLKIDKKEMHNPWKHILIGKKIVMIDFERCHKVDKGKNVTQFGQFLLRKKDLLKRKGISIKRKEFIKILKNYKNKETGNNYKIIITTINK